MKLFTGLSDVEIVAESFIAASEVYMDGIWKSGELQWSSMSRNHISPLSAVQGGVLAAHILDRRRYEALFQQAETLAGQALASLDAPDCVFHLEAFTEIGNVTQEDFERNFRFDEIQYASSPDAPVGPYGRVGQAIVSDPDAPKLQRTIEEIVRFNEAGGGCGPVRN
ncbi:hypothetical protein [Streptomyces malaysiensis]|uniref:hypothetical protein n=1 Tax=Streptomyces malaysiensis TaxID=92644 RepID=UPI002B28D9BA|nr:hypothetical protein R8789_43820 [Streptomyces malaysiensis]